jgi:uncharacterized membrane protein YdjX (TVP38/TMEM64 family)
MNQEFQSVFRVSCCVVLVLAVYYIYMMITTYFLLDKIKPEHVTDLPQLGNLFWVPFVFAFALFVFKN